MNYLLTILMPMAAIFIAHIGLRKGRVASDSNIEATISGIEHRLKRIQADVTNTRRDKSRLKRMLEVEMKLNFSTSARDAVQ